MVEVAKLISPGGSSHTFALSAPAHTGMVSPLHHMVWFESSFVGMLLD